MSLPTSSVTRLLTVASCCAALLSTASAAEWYVAVSGDDGAKGDMEHPFATVQRAQQAASPGDTVYLRGGTYRPTDAQLAETKGIFATITLLNKSGKPGPGQRITYTAYGAERPVFDCSLVAPEGKRISAFQITGSWLHLIGIEVTGVQVTIREHTQSTCFESNGSHNIFERLSMHDGQAIGIYHVRGSDNLFVNCDAWNNWDYTSEDGKGGNVDGFGCHPSKGSTANVFRGCRAWYNSDDGYDCLGSQEAVTFENCWAMYNGLSAKKDHLADGNGFKAGGYGKAPADRLPATIPRHVVRFCLAVGNKNNGFYANHHPGGSDWLNNSAFRNGINFNMTGRLRDNLTEVDGYGHHLNNNLSYHSRTDLARIDRAQCKLANNSWDANLKLTDKDFVSLDESQLVQPRQSDGDLPKITFLHPKPESEVARAKLGAF